MNREAIELITGFKTISPFHEKILASNAQYNIVVAGRRTGKSSFIALRLLLDAIKIPNLRILFSAPTLAQAKIYLEFYDKWFARTPTLWAPGGKFISRITKGALPEIHFTNGSSITLRSTASGGVSARGWGFDRVALIEACFLSNETFYSAIEPSTIDSTNCQIWIDTTPWSTDSFVYELVRRSETDPERYNCITATVEDVYHLSKPIIEELKRNTPPHIWNTEYMGQWMDSSDYVFSSEVISRAMDDTFGELGYRRGRRYRAGLDLGKSLDHTVLIILEEIAGKRSGVWRIEKLVRFPTGGVASYSYQIAEINRILKEYGNPMGYVDATGVGSAIVEDVPLRPFVFTRSSKEKLVSNLIMKIVSNSLSLPTSTSRYQCLFDELKHFKMDIVKSDHIAYRSAEGWHDDCVFALALALYEEQKISSISESVLAWKTSLDKYYEDKTI